MADFREIGTPMQMTEAAIPALQLTPVRFPSRGYSLPVGDMAERPHEHNVAILNHTLNFRGTPDSERIMQTSSELESMVIQYREAVSTKHSTEIVDGITARYNRADEATDGLDMKERIRARLATATSLNVVSDFDGTISLNPNSYLMTHIPGSAIAEPMLEAHGREAFSMVFASVWREFLTDPYAESFYFHGGREVPIRQGVDDLFGFLRDTNSTTTVLSANFEPFVEGGLSQLSNADGTNLIAVTKDSIVATDKGTVLKDLAPQSPEAATVFIGDGSSDIPAMEAQDLIACYFALEGSSFASELAKRGIAHSTYRTFTDIQLQLQELMPSLKQQEA